MSKQQKLFKDDKEQCTINGVSSSTDKSYRAIRHDVTRAKQKRNANELHHPDEKINQIKSIFNEVGYKPTHSINILELFAGEGNLTKIYYDYANCLWALEKNGKKFESLKNTMENSRGQANLIKADSYLEFHNMISDKQKFEVIDLDPYGFPNRFFPDIFLLIDNGVMFITMPKPYVNILNGITQTHLISYYGEHNPSKETIIERIALFGLCHWRKVELLDCVDCKSVWRFAFKVELLASTYEYTDTKTLLYL